MVKITKDVSVSADSSTSCINKLINNYQHILIIYSYLILSFFLEIKIEIRAIPIYLLSLL